MGDVSGADGGIELPQFDAVLFRGGTASAVGMDGIAVERRSLGFIDVADGRVYACDPLVPMDSAPLSHRLEPGRYEVVLFVLVGTRHGAAGERMECNAAAAIVCSSAKPEQWKLAAREGGAPDDAAYGVDSGTGGFMGSRAIELLLEADETAAQLIISALEQTSGAIVTVADGAAAAAFTSGVGDGVYDTWLGLGSRDEVAMILTDFDVLKSEEYVAEVHVKWAARKSKKWWQFWK
ncbi:MAG: DUF4241 domain-containing protein [Myxococcota bacterium]